MDKCELDSLRIQLMADLNNSGRRTILLGGLVLLGAYVFFDSEQGWTTISESNGYSLQAKGHRYRIQYYENDSARIDWYLNNYQPELNLNMRILERPTAPGSYTKEEIAGQGSASFLMVCRTWGSAENSQLNVPIIRLILDLIKRWR